MYAFARPSTGGKSEDIAQLFSPILNGSDNEVEWCLTFWYYLNGIRPRK